MIYRDKKLLEAAKDAPRCFGCGRPNKGDVVAAHSNQLRDGKGKGIKAHDFRVAYLCAECHREIDQGKGMTREERTQAWEEAHRESIAWLFCSSRVRAV